MSILVAAIACQHGAAELLLPAHREHRGRRRASTDPALAWRRSPPSPIIAGAVACDACPPLDQGRTPATLRAGTRSAAGVSTLVAGAVLLYDLTRLDFRPRTTPTARSSTCSPAHCWCSPSSASPSTPSSSARAVRGEFSPRRFAAVTNAAPLRRGARGDVGARLGHALPRPAAVMSERAQRTVVALRRLAMGRCCWPRRSSAPSASSSSTSWPRPRAPRPWAARPGRSCAR